MNRKRGTVRRIGAMPGGFVAVAVFALLPPLAVDTAGTFIPAEFSGTCRVDPAGPGADAWPWRILVDPARLRQGVNAVALFRVAGDGPDRRLVRLGTWGASLLGVDLGARPLITVPEHGFHQPEDWSGTPFRWTDGHAELRVPLGRQERPRQFTCRLVSTGPRGTHLRMLVDGAVVADRDLPKGAWNGTFDLPSLARRDSVTLEIDSDVFTPGGADDRVLGVGLAGIVLE